MMSVSNQCEISVRACSPKTISHCDQQAARYTFILFQLFHFYFAYILPCQKIHFSYCRKTSKSSSDMTKVQIKSHTPTPFAGIFSIAVHWMPFLSHPLSSVCVLGNCYIVTLVMDIIDLFP